jgi:hypothetical protein
MTNRMFEESPVTQGEGEAISYYFYSTPWGTSPTNVSVVVFDVTDADETADWVNVTATVMPVNSPVIAGDKITLSKLRSLTDGHIYRVEVAFTVSELGDTEAIFLVIGGE